AVGLDLGGADLLLAEGEGDLAVGGGGAAGGDGGDELDLLAALHLLLVGLQLRLRRVGLPEDRSGLAEAQPQRLAGRILQTVVVGDDEGLTVASDREALDLLLRPAVELLQVREHVDGELLRHRPSWYVATDGLLAGCGQVDGVDPLDGGAGAV